MDYVTPAIADYGDVAQLTADQQNRNSADQIIGTGETLGNLNSTGTCQTGFEVVGGICVPIAPGNPGP
jgi:hypothetical protein